MAYYETDFLTVEWNSDAEAVVLQWKGFAKGEDFRDGMDEGLELLVEKGANKLLGDSREMGAIDEADQQWSNEDWNPRAINEGLEHLALVMPESVIAEMSVERVMQEADDGSVNIGYFEDRGEAEEWLAEQ